MANTPAFDLDAFGNTPMNCMTLIAGKAASATGHVLVGHNEDDGGHVVVRHGWVPPRDWEKGAVMPAEEGCALLPQVAHTLGYYWVEYRKDVMGLSNADGFVNERGVVIVSNSMGTSREGMENADCVKDGGIAFNLRRALAELVNDGYVQTMQGRGVRVIYQPVGKTTFTIGGIETFQETARRNRLQAVTRVIRFETIIATEQFAAESGFSEGDELWAVQRVRYLDGKALILDINYFLKEFVPGLTEEIASHSIYDFIENVLGMQIITSKRRITVEHATARDEKLLDMDGYDCVAVVVNQTFNSDGMLFEYTQSRHQPDYFCFQDIATRKK